MSGPTAQQTELGDAQLEAYKQAAQLTQQQYANQQAIYGPMATQFESIYAKGPGQEGFSAPEVQDLDAQAVEGTAENYEAAEKAVGESTAAEGGGTNPLPTGAQTELKEQTAQSAAEEESRQESQIKSADYSQGYNEWEQAGQGLQSIAAGENPLGYESNETSSGTAAGTTASQIASEDDSWLNAAIGAGGSIAGSVISENPGNVFG
jgi:hypothetical protein